MIRYAYRYPDGAAGVALLLARLCHGFVAFGVAALLSEPLGVNVPRLAAALATLLLALGLATRAAALVLGVGVAAAFCIADPVQQLLLAGHIGGCAALFVLGAGAFSLDARRHGRRVIRMQANTPDRGSDD